MKVISSSSLLLVLTSALTSSVFAFAPAAVARGRSRTGGALSGSKRVALVPRFMAAGDAAEDTVDAAEADSMTLEEEIQALVDKEVEKNKLISKLKTSDGVDYAPWMNISEEDEKKIYQTMKEKALARRKRKEQQQNVSGNLYLDSQAQELSGTGLNSKIMGQDVELEWATSSETNTKGFIVKRRPAKTDAFSVVASYESWGPLVSKGTDGGVYRYLDTDVGPGGWVYRVTECDNDGKESDVCQCLVEVQTEEEQKAAVFAAVGIAVIGLAAVAAGLLLDPLDGF